MLARMALKGGARGASVRTSEHACHFAHACGAHVHGMWVHVLYMCRAWACSCVHVHAVCRRMSRVMCAGCFVLMANAFLRWPVSATAQLLMVVLVHLGQGFVKNQVQPLAKQVEERAEPTAEDIKKKVIRPAAQQVFS